MVVFEAGSGVLVEGRPNRSTSVPKMTAGRAALVSLMHQYLVGLLDPSVTLLEAHKLMYFMQVSGESLRLRFQKAHYGPYAQNLRHVLKDIEGHLISGYADDGDSPGKQLELVPGSVEDATAFLEGRPKTKQRLEHVAQLIEGFESPFGLELLSTVHWVAVEHPAATEQEVVADTYRWGLHKKQFSKRQIGLALQVLKDKGWLESEVRA